jgi:glycerophosphoryl diester phosphodiesterase
MSPSRPLVIAHRGASGYELENSLAAFRAAAPRGADAVELDVHSTADGEFVVHHDEQLEDGRHIGRSTAAALATARLANGEPLPTLAQALSAIGDRLAVFVEVKTLAPQFDQRFLAVLAAGPNPDGYAIHSFDHRMVKRVGALAPSLRRGVLNSSSVGRPLAALSKAGALDCWQEQSLVNPRLVASVHRAGGRVIAWTVNNGDRMRELIGMGVDGLCSNYPDIARRAVDALAA